MNIKVMRGEIFYADLNPVIGSEQGGIRPVLIIQNNIGNKHSPTVVVAAITSRTTNKAKLPTHAALPLVIGLDKDSIVLLEQLRTIDKTRLRRYVGTLDEIIMKGIDDALMISMGIENEKSKKSNEPLLLTLCASCVKQFYNSSSYVVKRTDFNQKHKEPCCYCNYRTGWDYYIINK